MDTMIAELLRVPLHEHVIHIAKSHDGAETVAVVVVRLVAVRHIYQAYRLIDAGAINEFATAKTLAPSERPFRTFGLPLFVFRVLNPNCPESWLPEPHMSFPGRASPERSRMGPQGKSSIVNHQ